MLSARANTHKTGITHKGNGMETLDIKIGGLHTRKPGK